MRDIWFVSRRPTLSYTFSVSQFTPLLKCLRGYDEGTTLLQNDRAIAARHQFKKMNAQSLSDMER